MERFGLVYASAQKNLGVAGLTLVIVRDDLLDSVAAGVPAPLNYGRQARERSRVNTPPVFAIQVAGLMLRWVKSRGGPAAMTERAARRSRRLYDLIDGSGTYECPVPPAERSSVNVCFGFTDRRLETAFLTAATRRGLSHLRGHPAVGGVRVSLYNGLPDEAVEDLVGFMTDFARCPSEKA
jgi:phosphoserine aminotransferase